MSRPIEPTAVAAALRGALGGRPPGPGLLEDIGGWDALKLLAPTVVDDPILTPAIALLVQELDRACEAGDDLAPAAAAAVALTDAVLDSRDPLQVTQGLEMLSTAAVTADLVGRHVGAACVRAAAPPREAGDVAVPDGAEVVRSAAALEAAARLAAAGYVSRHKVLAALADVSAPQPLRYARAVARTVTLAFDLWAPEDEVADVIDVLIGARDSGVAAAGARARELDVQYSLDIAPDALWAAANVEIARALRAQDASSASEHFVAALTTLELLQSQDDRPDAQLLRTMLGLVCQLLPAISRGPGSTAVGLDLDESEIRTLERNVDAFALGAYGLDHWSSDRKLVVLRGWQRFVRDLAYLHDTLERDSLYEAAVVLDNVLAIYSASHSYDITHASHGVEHLLRELRPGIERSFAARAGLLRNLSDHTEALQRRVDAAASEAADSVELLQRLDTARTVLSLARERLLTSPEPPGKTSEQAANLPPLLRELFIDHPEASEALTAKLKPDQMRALSAELADMQASTQPGLIETRVRTRILGKLSESEDFKGDVVPAVTGVLDQLIAFLSRRMNTQKSRKAYLFDPNASEADLHADLYDWLSQGQFSSQTNVEVQEVGAGRVDIQIAFAGFHLYLELKADARATPVEEKQAYIKQTVAYQATDVRIGFLVVLRLAPAKGKSPSAHLSDYVTHATVLIDGSASERHVVMLEVPGNQIRPSGM